MMKWSVVALLSACGGSPEAVEGTRVATDPLMLDAPDTERTLWDQTAGSEHSPKGNANQITKMGTCIKTKHDTAKNSISNLR